VLLHGVGPGRLVGPFPGRGGPVEDERRDAIRVRGGVEAGERAAVAGREEDGALAAGGVADRRDVAEERLVSIGGVSAGVKRSEQPRPRRSVTTTRVKRASSRRKRASAGCSQFSSTFER
jgi:hypothetical protein